MLQLQVDRSGSIDKAARALSIPRSEFRELCRQHDVRAKRTADSGERSVDSSSASSGETQAFSAEQDGQTCVSCMNETDTGVGVWGDVNFHAAVLCSVGIPLAEAAALIECFVDVGEPFGYVLCARCASRIHVTPKPTWGPMPLLSLDTLGRRSREDGEGVIPTTVPRESVVGH